MYVLSCSQFFIRLIDQSWTHSCGRRILRNTLYPVSFFSWVSFSSFFVVSFDHASIFCFLGLRVSQLMGTSINPFNLYMYLPAPNSSLNFLIRNIRPGCQIIGCPLSRVLRAHRISCLFLVGFSVFVFFVFSSFSVLSAFCVFCVS